MKSFAMTNIGPSNRWVGLSTSALLDARGGNAQVCVVGERFAHQRIELPGREVDQRRLPPFEHAVPDDLRCDACDNQDRRQRP